MLAPIRRLLQRPVYRAAWRAVVWGGLAGAVLLGIGALYERRAEAKDAQLVANDTFAEVSGRRIRYRLVKAEGARSTVVFVTGMIATLEQMAGVGRGIGNRASWLTYDRGGMGFSDPLPGEYDPRRAASELIGLVKAVGVPHPRILIAYSSSAVVARTVLTQYPGEFDGALFIDPSVTGLIADNGAFDRAASRASGRRWMAKQMVLKAIGFDRFRREHFGDSLGGFPGLTERELAIRLAADLRYSHWVASFNTFEEWNSVWLEGGGGPKPGQWGALPLVIISSAKDEADVAQAHQVLAGLSTRGRVTPARAGHLELVAEGRDTIAEDIRALVDEVERAAR
jgi:pimeloyl-ACP methyl ester carboxylesterase